MLIALARILERGLGNSLSGDNSKNIPTNITPPEILSTESENLTKSAEVDLPESVITVESTPGDSNISAENQDVNMLDASEATEIIKAKVHKKAKSSAVAQYVYCITASNSPN
jgi:hypothetical protein